MSRNGLTQWGWKEMEEMLQCPVCLDIPSPGMIEQCRHGHHVCGSCRRNVETCPLCKCEFYGTRNFILEELVRHFDILKNTMLLNNIVTDTKLKKKIRSIKIRNDPATQLLKSQPLKRKVNTPVTSKGRYPCRAPDCDVSLPMSRLLNHVRSYHAGNLTESVVDFTDVYNQTFEVPFRTKNPINKNCFIMFVSGIGLIYLNLELMKTGHLIGYLQMASNFDKCQDYLGSLQLFSETTTFVHSYNSRLLSTRVGFTSLLVNYDCFTLNKSQLKKICGLRQFNCKLTLTRFDPLSSSVLTQPARDELRLVTGVRASLSSEQYDNQIIKQLENPKNKNTVSKAVPSTSRSRSPNLEVLVAKVIESLNLQGVISNAVKDSTATSSTSAAAPAAAPAREEPRRKQNKKKKTRRPNGV